MEKKTFYCSYDDYSIIFDCGSGCFSVSEKGANVLRDGKLFLKQNDNDVFVPIDAYKTFKQSRIYSNAAYGMRIQFSDGDFLPDSCVEIKVKRDGVHLSCSEVQGFIWCASGSLLWGEDMAEDTFAMSDDAIQDGLIRSAIGPATSTRDNMLYNRKTDEALVLNAAKVRLFFDWEQHAYCCSLSALEDASQEFAFLVKRNILAEKYDITFAPVNKNCTFSKPPAGWMTWYAVKFNANEESVLRNVHFQQEHLKRYGANTVWVDWEWYHQDMSGRRDDGVDTFHPDPQKYPNGLKYVSDEIKKSGFVPALWVGFTNEPFISEYMKKYPDILLGEKKTWCGTYFYDFSHPAYLNEYLPKALAQVADWGYEAVKFDTLPNAIYDHEEFHDNMYDPSMTTKEAFRGMVKKAREIIGKDVYMMSCASCEDPHFLWAADLFDGGRVGGDIFGWKEFLWECIGKISRYYPLHNIVLYADPDNVVLRDEFNTPSQAVSRIAFVSLLGLPMTFGDDFQCLNEERVSLIQKCLPVLDIHPKDLQIMDVPEFNYDDLRLAGIPVPDFPKEKIIVNLAVEKPFERYNVVDVFNPLDEKRVISVSVEKDLSLEPGAYHVFDSMRQEYLGCITDCIDLEAEPCGSRIVSFRAKLDRPQLLSTSRHISQGAAEIRDLIWNSEKCEFSLCCELLAGEPYKAFLYVPAGYETVACDQVSDQVYCYACIPTEDGEMKITIPFRKI